MNGRDVTREHELKQEIDICELLNQKVDKLNQALCQDKRDFERRLVHIQQAKQALVEQAKTLQDRVNMLNRTASDLE